MDRMIMQDGLLLRAWNALGRVDAGLTGGHLPATGGDGVLMFHSIGDGAHEDLPPTAFRSLIARLDESVTFVDIPELFETESDERRIALTFDDGYEGYHDYVVPILEEFDAPSTVFVVANTLRDGPEPLQEAFREDVMPSDKVAAVADNELVTVGNHTMSHPNLQSVSDHQRLYEEIVRAKEIIEDEIGVSVNRFCYPYNDQTPAALTMVRDSHDFGVAGGGWATILETDTNPYLIPRVNAARPWWRIRWHLLNRSTHLALGIRHLTECVRL